MAVNERIQSTPPYIRGNSREAIYHWQVQVANWLKLNNFASPPKLYQYRAIFYSLEPGIKASAKLSTNKHDCTVAYWLVSVDGSTTRPEVRQIIVHHTPAANQNATRTMNGVTFLSGCKHVETLSSTQGKGYIVHLKSTGNKLIRWTFNSVYACEFWAGFYNGSTYQVASADFST